MSIQVNDFRWEPGKNDAEYIKLLESSRNEWQKIAQKAIAKLKALSKAHEPRVMTLDEVVITEPGTVIWLEDYDKPTIIPGLVDRVFIWTKVIDFQLVQRTVTADLDVYGTTWRCWTSRPTDEQREATPWQAPSTSDSASNG